MEWVLMVTWFASSVASSYQVEFASQDLCIAAQRELHNTARAFEERIGTTRELPNRTKVTTTAVPEVVAICSKRK